MTPMHCELLGTETIQVRRAFRLVRAITRIWRRLAWRPITRPIYIIRIPVEIGLPALQGRLDCESCGRRLRWPQVPDAAYSRATFGCAWCHAYYFVDASQGIHEPQYAELRARLQETA